MLQIPQWMSEEALLTLKKGYLLSGESPRSLFQRVATSSAKTLIEIAPQLSTKFVADYKSDLFHILWEGWLGLATPVAANAGTTRGLPISCYAVSLSDSIPSIFSHLKETAVMSQRGGGVGIYLGNVRARGTPISSGGESTGIVPWANIYDTQARTVSQGNTRRGAFSFYLPIDHPDLQEFLDARDQTKGDPRKFIDSNIAVVIPDQWLMSMLDGDTTKQKIFTDIVKLRLMTGSPYLLFIDNVNKANPPGYKINNLDVSTSNICTEITLYTDENHSFICCLSSLNLRAYDEWATTPRLGWTLPFISTIFLDTILEEFIKKASVEVGLGRAVRSAKKGRAIGLGVMGLHSLYQRRKIPFESLEARTLNKEIHSFIKTEARKGSEWLASIAGEPEWCQGTGQRNTHLLAVAPTRTNSVISGAFSQGIEPIEANFFVAKQSQGTFNRKNPELEALLEEKEQNTEQVWDRIRDDRGSVQQLDFLSESEKQVYKTAREIDQNELIQQAADRQDFICQAQSLNLFVDPFCDESYLVELHLKAWALGLKSLYYLRSRSLQTYDTTNFIVTTDNCSYCSALKNALKMKGISFRELTKEQAITLGIWKKEWTTVPQLFLDGKYIGGYTDFIDLYSAPMNTDSGDCLACEG